MKPEELRKRIAAELPDAQVVVALGGGADSAVAAWVCAPHPGTRAIFVDHALAGSDGLRGSAEALAAAIGMPLTVISAPVAEGPNLEGRARAARWRAIRDELASDEVVVTGHSSDDLGETLLINLLRGAGSAGLGAMSAPRHDVVRPVLGLTRAELRNIAESAGLPFTDDPANDERRHLRNRIRADLIPLLERDYQPAARRNLARAGTHLAADDAVLEASAAAVPIRNEEGAVVIPSAMLRTVPGPIAARVVRRALRSLNPPYAGSAADVDKVIGVAEGELASISVTGGLSATLEGPYVAIWDEEPSAPHPIVLESPGSVVFGGGSITAVPARTAAIKPRSGLFVDPALFDGGVTVRGAEPGERIDIDDGTKLVRDALAESGVPRRLRVAWPVLADGAKIAAIVGGRVAPWARPTGDEAVYVTREQV